jgi:hypothetical protein
LAAASLDVALIDINTDELEALTPQHAYDEKSREAEPMKYAKRGYVLANITYHDPNVERKTEEQRIKDNHGTFIYLTTTFFEGLSPDLYAYFDERQFEAYRELGFQTANWMMCDPAVLSHRYVKEIMGAPHIGCPDKKK